MAAIVFGTKAAVLRLLQDLAAACGFPEWGGQGTEGATGPGCGGQPWSPGCWRGAPWDLVGVPLTTPALGK